MCGPLSKTLSKQLTGKRAHNDTQYTYGNMEYLTMEQNLSQSLPYLACNAEDACSQQREPQSVPISHPY